MADMIIAFLQDELARLLVEPVLPQEAAATTEELPPPMLPGNHEHSSICLEERNLRSAVVRSKVRAHIDFTHACGRPQWHVFREMEPSSFM
jgi:hypothetical protein